jgi:hypothetical protein
MMLVFVATLVSNQMGLLEKVVIEMVRIGNWDINRHGIKNVNWGPSALQLAAEGNEMVDEVNRYKHTMGEKVCDYCGENIWPGTPFRVVGETDTPYLHNDCFELMVEEGLIERHG